MAGVEIAVDSFYWFGLWQLLALDPRVFPARAATELTLGKVIPA